MATTLLTSAVKSAAGLDSTVARAVDKLPNLEVNVGGTERWLSLAAGGTVAALCLSGRTPPLVSTLLGTALVYRGLTGHCALYRALGLNSCGATNACSVAPSGRGTKVEHAITVNRPAQEVYRFWRDLENLPAFMTHLIDVNTSTDGRSHWIAKGPLGIKVEWEAEIITDRPNQVISWRSLPGGDVDTAGSVHFDELPHGRGTEVRVVLSYTPPGGKTSAAVAKLIGPSPEAQIRADMRRFKQLLEAGEIPSTNGQPHGAR